MTTSHLTPAQRKILDLADECLTMDEQDRLAKSSVQIAQTMGRRVTDTYIRMLAHYLTATTNA